MRRLFYTLLCIFVWTGIIQAALPSTGVLQVQPGGSDTQCAGGYDPAIGVTDYSQQNAAQATGTATSASTTVTATTGIFTAAMVGNYITDGTIYREITAYTSALIVTVDAAPSWTAATIYVGGSFASPGKAMGVTVAGNDMWVKSGTYPCTTSTPNVSGGVIDFVAGVSMQGYATTKGDMGTPPTITAGALTSVTLVKLEGSFATSGTGASSAAINISVDGLGNSSVIGFYDATAYTRVLSHCKANNCAIGFDLQTSGSPGWITFCGTVACGTGFNSSTGTRFQDCRARDSVSAGFFSASFSSSYDNCIASGTTAGHGFDQVYGGVFSNCIGDRNSGDGIHSTTYDINHCVNCVMTNNGGFGYGNDVGGMFQFIRCSGYNNASGLFKTTPRFNTEPLILTADPWTSSTDFRPNSTAGGGQVLKAAGLGVYGQINSRDAGAVQSAGSGGGSSGVSRSAVVNHR